MDLLTDQIGQKISAEYHHELGRCYVDAILCVYVGIRRQPTVLKIQKFASNCNFVPADFSSYSFEQPEGVLPKSRSFARHRRLESFIIQTLTRGYLCEDISIDAIVCIFQNETDELPYELLRLHWTKPSEETCTVIKGEAPAEGSHTCSAQYVSVCQESAAQPPYPPLPQLQLLPTHSADIHPIPSDTAIPLALSNPPPLNITPWRLEDLKQQQEQVANDVQDPVQNTIYVMTPYDPPSHNRFEMEGTKTICFVENQVPAPAPENVSHGHQLITNLVAVTSQLPSMRDVLAEDRTMSGKLVSECANALIQVQNDTPGATALSKSQGQQNRLANNCTIVPLTNRLESDQAPQGAPHLLRKQSRVAQEPTPQESLKATIDEAPNIPPHVIKQEAPSPEDMDGPEITIESVSTHKSEFSAPILQACRYCGKLLLPHLLLTHEEQWCRVRHRGISSQTDPQHSARQHREISLTGRPPDIQLHKPRNESTLHSGTARESTSRLDTRRNYRKLSPANTLKPCKYCGEVMSANRLFGHIYSNCKMRIPVLSVCNTCGKLLQTGPQKRSHLANCVLRWSKPKQCKDSRLGCTGYVKGQDIWTCSHCSTVLHVRRAPAHEKFGCKGRYFFPCGACGKLFCEQRGRLKHIDSGKCKKKLLSGDNVVGCARCGIQGIAYSLGFCNHLLTCNPTQFPEVVDKISRYKISEIITRENALLRRELAMPDSGSHRRLNTLRDTLLSLGGAVPENPSSHLNNGQHMGNSVSTVISCAEKTSIGAEAEESFQPEPMKVDSVTNEVLTSALPEMIADDYEVTRGTESCKLIEHEVAPEHPPVFEACTNRVQEVVAGAAREVLQVEAMPKVVSKNSLVATNSTGVTTDVNDLVENILNTDFEASGPPMLNDLDVLQTHATDKDKKPKRKPRSVTKRCRYQRMYRRAYYQSGRRGEFERLRKLRLKDKSSLCPPTAKTIQDPTRGVGTKVNCGLKEYSRRMRKSNFKNEYVYVCGNMSATQNRTAQRLSQTIHQFKRSGCEGIPPHRGVWPLPKPVCPVEVKSSVISDSCRRIVT